MQKGKYFREVYSRNGDSSIFSFKKLFATKGHWSLKQVAKVVVGSNNYKKKVVGQRQLLKKLLIFCFEQVLHQKNKSADFS